LAQRAIRLGRDDAVALANGGWVLDYLAKDSETAAAYIDRARVLNPNLASAWLASGWVRFHLGDPDTAIVHFAQAMRLSPLDQFMYSMQTGMACAQFSAGRSDEAALWADRALRENPVWHPALITAAASHAVAGRIAHAQMLIARSRELDPAFSISRFADTIPLARPEDLARFAEGFRKAGLPD
jgi:tetratricopeptide (TPR) repeat protein